MRQNLLRVRPLACIIVFLMCSLAACGNTLPASPPAKALAATHSFTLSPGQGFFPFIQVVPVNSTVAFVNNDAIGHNILNTLNTTSSLNPVGFGMTLLPHSQQETTFTQPGIYDIYDNVYATYDDSEQRVTALSHNPIAPYPLPIECILWVQGDVPTIPATADATITADTHTIDMNFLAITRGGSINWRNAGTMAVTLQPVPGWQAPINPAIIPPLTIPGGTVKPITQTFTTPGLYYYYSPTYSDVDRVSQRAIARVHAVDYPVAVDGFILVV